MTTLSCFKSFEAYERYRLITQQIENEKGLLMQYISYKEEYFNKIQDYDGAYSGLQTLIDSLRKYNASITVTKNNLKHLTRKYYELLKYFTHDSTT